MGQEFLRAPGCPEGSLLGTMLSHELRVFLGLESSGATPGSVWAQVDSSVTHCGTGHRPAYHTQEGCTTCPRWPPFCQAEVLK